MKKVEQKSEAKYLNYIFCKNFIFRIYYIMTTYTENNVNYVLRKDGSMMVFNSPNATDNIEIKSSITLDAVAYSVTYIVGSAFKNNSNITGVIIPSTITDIESGAFQGCTQLSKVYFKGQPVTNSDSFSAIYLPSNDPDPKVVGPKAGTAYIKNMYNPNGNFNPTISRLEDKFNIVYLESSVMDAFAFPPPPPPPPAAPTGLTASILGTTATINFTQPSNGSAAVTSYTYATSSDNITYSSFVNTNLIKVSATQVTISGLTLGSTYYFKLIADNGSPSVASTASNSVFVNFPLAQPTITNIRSTEGVTSISFQNPSDTSITNYAYSTINVLDIENSVLPPFSSYTLLSPAQTTSPLTINGLHGVVQIKIKAFNGSYSDESSAFNNWYEPPFV